jgi:formylmethanofuran dehydrogenase subunit E
MITLEKFIDNEVKKCPTLKCDLCNSIKPSLRIKILDKIACKKCYDNIIKAGLKALNLN